MSILKALGIRNMLLSLLEVIVFFAVITPVYFVLLAGIYAGASRAELGVDLKAIAPPETFLSAASWGVQAACHLIGRLAAVLPVWMWVVQVAGYLLLITIYWSPGDAPLDHAELGGLVLFVLLVGVTGLAWLELSYHAVSGTVRTFWQIVTGGMVSGG